MSEKCERCNTNFKTEPHPCPFSEEIWGDSKLCTCCEECTHECAMDI